MAGRSTRMKKARGEALQKAKLLQASREREQRLAQQQQAVSRLVSNYQEAKAKGRQLQPGYYPRNPNYEPGFLIPQVDRHKEGYISMSAIKQQAEKQELERIHIANQRAAIKAKLQEVERLKNEARIAQIETARIKKTRDAELARRKIQNRREHFTTSSQYSVTKPIRRPVQKRTNVSRRVQRPRRPLRR